jgi:hypothetical protein
MELARITLGYPYDHEPPWGWYYDNLPDPKPEPEDDDFEWSDYDDDDDYEWEDNGD